MLDGVVITPENRTVGGFTSKLHSSGCWQDLGPQRLLIQSLQFLAKDSVPQSLLAGGLPQFLAT